MTNNSYKEKAIRVITVCQPQIVHTLQTYTRDSYHETMVFFQSDSYKSCLETLSVENFNLLILEITSPISKLQDFLHNLQKCNINIEIILFQITNETTIYFTATNQTGLLSTKVSDFFINALTGKYQCHFMKYKDPIWDQRFQHNEAGLKKREVFLDLLRGLTNEEFEPFRYQFNLQGNGYYLFVWEQNTSELSNYLSLKNILNFICEIQKEEYISELENGSGGEVLILNITTIIILFNDYINKSVARRITEMQKMKNKLASIGSSQSSHQFISEYISGIDKVYKAYEAYQKSRPYRFFCREDKVLTFKTIELRHRWIPDEVIDETLKNIRDIIRYDIRSEILPMLVRRIFLEIIKPSMSYTLYYTLSDAIHSMLKNEMAINNLRDALDDPDLLSSVQFSSIEEKCDEMLQFIQSLQKQIVNKSNLHNALVLKTISYINENYNLDIKVSQIAKVMNVSSACLNHHFKSEVGRGVKCYLTELRIEKAKILLESTDDLIYSIASNVGFSDFRHFSKTFKQITDSSPSQFRKRTSSPEM